MIGPVQTEDQHLVLGANRGRTLRNEVVRWAQISGRAIDIGLDGIVGLAVLTELAILFGNAIGRSYFNYPLDWSLEAAELALEVMAFIGGAAAYRRGQHVYLRSAINRLPEQLRRALLESGDWIVIGLSLMIAIQAIPLVEAAVPRHLPALPISEAWNVVPLPIGLLGFAYYGLRKVLSKPGIRTVIGVAAVATFLTVTQVFDATQLLSSETAAAAGLLSFVILLLVGLPLAFVFVASATVYLVGSGASNLQAIPITMHAAASGFTLLALPFFIMAGHIMTDGGMSRPLALFAKALVGRLPGALLHVLVVGTFMFSGLSGSKLADITAVGSATRKMLEDEGYDSRESAGVLNASAIAGETVGPSFAFLILAPIAALSFSDLLAAGLLPGLTVALALMIVIAIRHRSRPSRVTTSAPWLGELWQTGIRAFPALLVPLILVVGFRTGVATPTEVSSFAVIFAMVVAVVVYRQLNPAQFWGMVIKSACTTGMILFLVSGAVTLSWSFSLAGIPQAIARPLIEIGSHSAWLFLIVAIVMMILLGSVLEGLSSILIFAPILFPVAAQLGIDPLHFAIVFLIAQEIGVFAPPVGIGAYFSAHLMGETMESAAKEQARYIVVLIVALVLVALVPWLTLALPHALQAKP